MKPYLLLLTLFSSSLCFASPFKYNNCHQDIKEPKNSSGYAFSKDCNTIYVYPPKMGNIEVTGYSPAVSDTDCRIINVKRDIIGDLLSEAQIISKNLFQLKALSKKKQVQYIRMDLACESLNGPYLAVKTKAEAMEAQVSTYKQEAEELSQSISQCADSGQACSPEQAQLRRVQRYVQASENQLRLLKGKLPQLESHYTSCKNRYSAGLVQLKTSIDTIEEQITELLNEVNIATTDFKAELSSETLEAGGTVQLTFSINQNDLVKEFKDLNPNINNLANFVSMPIKNMDLGFSAIIDGTTARAPGVIRSNIPGTKIINDESDESLIELNDTVSKNVVMGAALSGPVTLNRLAACNFQTSHNRNNLSALLVANAKYNYDLIARRKYKVDYLESHLYELIKKHSTKGGFFTTRSSTSITEKSISKQWIDIEIDAEDSDFEYTNREQMITDLKNEYLNRALLQVALGFFQEGHPALPAAPSRNGAQASSEALKKCPYLYCQVAGFALDIANTVFGGTSSTAGQKKYAKAEATQWVREERPIVHTGTMSFKMESFE